jgi:hypothetical protein
LASRGQKKSQKTLTHPMKKFGILDGTKHTHKNFDILHFIIPKLLAFCIPRGTKHNYSKSMQLEQGY